MEKTIGILTLCVLASESSINKFKTKLRSHEYDPSSFSLCLWVMWWRSAKERYQIRRKRNRVFIWVEKRLKTHANAGKSLITNFLSFAASISSTRALPVIDYDDYEGAGNAIYAKDADYIPTSVDYRDNEPTKRDPEFFVGSQKRNIISALRAKMRRSKTDDIEDKLRFSPVLSVGKHQTHFPLISRPNTQSAF